MNVNFNDLPEIVSTDDSPLMFFPVKTDQGWGRISVPAFIAALGMTKELSNISEKLPTIVIGGDHPYKQWYGTNGKNGMAAMYLDNGIRPYIAINVDAVDGPDSPDMMTWKECQQLQAMGVEFVSHGQWHVDKWSRINTGLRIEYIGGNASATVQITTTQLIATSAAPSADSVTVTFATDNTLAKVKTALEANGKWRVTLDAILVGDEPSTNLFAMNAARNVLTPATNQYFCAGGGIELTYSGRSYRNVFVRRTSTGSFTIFADGVTKYNLALGTTSIATLVTAINAIAGGAFSAKPCDNGRTETSSKPSYLIGDELATNLKTLTHLEMSSRPVVLDAGLPMWYIHDRHFTVVKAIAAANGITLRHFAQSGGNFYSWHTTHGQYGLYRGNNLYRQTTPMFMQRSRIKNFVTHRTLTDTGVSPTYRPGNCLALIDAIAGYDEVQKNEPWVVVLLVHKLQPDGSSGYSLPTADNYYDQTEASLATMLGAIRKKVEAGLLQTATFDELSRMSRGQSPVNMFFNPNFKCAEASLIPAAGTQDGGFFMPGWLIVRAATVSAMSVADGIMTVTNSSTTATELLSQDVELVPGKTYGISAFLDVQSYTAGNGIQWSIQSLNGRFQGINTPATNFKVTGAQINQTGEIVARFTVPQPANFVPPFVISDLVEPFNLSANPNIRLNILSLGSIDNLNCAAGAVSSAAVTAKEVAAAINAAVAANASYPAEYHNCARAEAGRVIVQAPYIGTDQGATVSILTATTTSGTAIIFGNATCEGRPSHHALPTSEQFVMRLALRSSLQGTFTIRAPQLREIEYN